MREGWEYVIPAPGEVSATARALLEAADDPSQVLTHRGGMEFSVPEHVAARWRDNSRPRSRGRQKKEG